MALAAVDLETVLLELAVQIPRDFAMYDDARAFWKETSDDPKYCDRALAAVKKWRCVLDSRADEIRECAGLVQRPARAKLLHAAVRLRNLDREVSAMLTDAAAALHDDSAADEQPLGKTKWSRPMSKKQAAKLLGCPHAKKAEWINQCVKDGIYKIRRCTRQTVQFDLAKIPVNLRDKFTPK